MKEESPEQPDATQRDIYSISRLNHEVRGMLEADFPMIWVEGEISNIARPSSGHLYFSLKDETAQVRCAMFRTRSRHIGLNPDNGMQVLARARVSLYEPRGDFQLIVEQMEETGDGALRRAFELLKQRLSAEGLFDPAHKIPLPALPRQIGIITSPSGAAIRDILHVLKRRFPALPVLIYSIPVQGASAAPEIARMINLAAQRNECDVLILARGGGSLEDLWAFNEEMVARAIYHCPIPIITGIGHEIDFTIADFAADVRAPTPSAAAELVSPDMPEWLALLQQYQKRLIYYLNNQLQQKETRLQWLLKRIRQQHPGQRIRQRAQRLDELEQRLHRGVRSTLRHDLVRLGEITAHLLRATPQHKIAQYQSRCRHLSHQLITSLRYLLERYRQQLSTLSRTLGSVSPLATLGRGYAIIRRVSDGRVIRSYQDAKTGDEIEARLATGRLICDVKEQIP
ncbi:MAG TPA: exodeoxyribonuclease VII large subunit [Gammaproteobacteria bacterium]